MDEIEEEDCSGYLSDQQTWEMFDDHCREYLNMSGNDFEARFLEDMDFSSKSYNHAVAGFLYRCWKG